MVKGKLKDPVLQSQGYLPFNSPSIQGTTANAISTTKSVLGRIVPMNAGTAWQLNFYDGSNWSTDATAANWRFQYVTAMGFGVLSLDLLFQKGILVEQNSSTSSGNLLIEYAHVT